MTEFVRWLVDDGREVRLLVGDEVDETVAERIVDEVGSGRVVHRGDVHDGRSAAQDRAGRRGGGDPVPQRVCAVKLAKPTVSIGYAAKSDAIMAEMGLGEFCQ